jgi:hypothetical protein
VIQSVNFDTSPIHAGDSRPLTAFANSPLTIVVKCYLTTPPPPVTGHVLRAEPYPPTVVRKLESGLTRKSFSNPEIS